MTTDDVAKLAREAAEKLGNGGFTRNSLGNKSAVAYFIQAAIDAACAELLADHTKLMGVVQEYITAPGQIRGEAYRDLVGTFDWLNGKRKLDELSGWAMCYEREKQRAEAAELRINELETERNHLQVAYGSTGIELAEVAAERDRLRKLLRCCVGVITKSSNDWPTPQEINDIIDAAALNPQLARSERKWTNQL